jgi:hypothetical protein
MQTAKQIPKQDLKITSKIKPKEKNKKQGKQTKTNRTTKQDKTYTKKGRTRSIGRARIDVRLGSRRKQSRGFGTHKDQRNLGRIPSQKASSSMGIELRFCWGFLFGG